MQSAVWCHSSILVFIRGNSGQNLNFILAIVYCYIPLKILNASIKLEFVLDHFKLTTTRITIFGVLDPIFANKG